MNETSNELKFVVFGEAVLYDYIDMILPNVWDELATVDSFEEADIIALAGELNGETVGVAVARITSGDEVQIYSIFVDPDHRRKKVGTALLDMIVEIASRAMEDDDNWTTQVVETIDFTLEDEDYKNFTAFLKSAGFVRFDELNPLFILPGSDAKALAATPADTHLFDELEGEAKEVSQEYIDSLGLPVDLSLTGYVGPFEEPLGAAFAIPFGDGDYSITSVGEGLDEESYRHLLSRMFAAVAAQTDDFTILADGTRNPYPQVWEKLSENVNIYPRCIAHRIVVFEGEE